MVAYLWINTHRVTIGSHYDLQICDPKVKDLIFYQQLISVLLVNQVLFPSIEEISSLYWQLKLVQRFLHNLMSERAQESISVHSYISLLVFFFHIFFFRGLGHMDIHTFGLMDQVLHMIPSSGIQTVGDGIMNP